LFFLSQRFSYILIFYLGILHGFHWGLGHGIGELIGGFMVSKLGAAATFNIFGVLTLLHLLIFWLINNYAKRKLFPRKEGAVSPEEGAVSPKEGAASPEERTVSPEEAKEEKEVEKDDERKVNDVYLDSMDEEISQNK